MDLDKYFVVFKVVFVCYVGFFVVWVGLFGDVNFIIGCVWFFFSSDCYVFSVIGFVILFFILFFVVSCWFKLVRSLCMNIF